MRYTIGTRPDVQWPGVSFEFPCEIADGTRIWPGSSIMRDAKIGKDCTIGRAVHIGRSVKIGDGCKIQNGAQLFEGVTLEEQVFVGPCVVFTNVTSPRAFVDRKAEFKPTLVKRGASIGANATVICGVTIGEYALVGAGAVVTRDVQEFTCVIGSPARKHAFVCVCGELLPLMRIKYGSCTCARRYTFTGSGIVLRAADE